MSCERDESNTGNGIPGAVHVRPTQGPAPDVGRGGHAGRHVEILPVGDRARAGVTVVHVGRPLVPGLVPGHRRAGRWVVESG